MRKALALVLIFCIVSIGPLAEALAGARQPVFPAGTPPQEYGQEYDQVLFSPEQLENLLAPIALYPDPLLAQVLLAATFPDQIDEAARTLRGYGTNYNIDATWWDVSVKAVAHYPTVLSMMADKIDWTTSLGQAYVNQSTDVMDAVQRLRAQARALGNLNTSAQQEIVENGGYLYIYPAQPSYIYVPVYDPAIVYFHRRALYAAPIVWFGVGLLIGAWLNHDCDWRGHRVYYHGWERGPVWVERSRSHIRVNNVYVNNNYRNINVNRSVVNRNVNYDALNRYNKVHRDVNYDNVRRQREGAGTRQQQPPGARQQPPSEQQRDNKIIRRNIDPRDPRIDANRGRDRQQGQPGVRQPDQPRPDVQRPDVQRQPDVRRPDVQRQPDVRRPEVQRQPDVRVPQTTQPPPTRQPDVRRPDVQRQPNVRVPQTTQPPPTRQPEVRRPETPREVPRPPETRRPEQIRPQAQPPQAQPPHSVFRGNTGAIDSRSAGQRGQESRQQPPAAAHPAPAQRTVTQPPPKGQDRRPR